MISLKITDFRSPHPMLILVLLPLPLCYIRFMELPLKESKRGLGVVSPQILPKQRLNQNSLLPITQPSNAVILSLEGERRLTVLPRTPEALLRPLVLQGCSGAPWGGEWPPRGICRGDGLRRLSTNARYGAKGKP